MKRFLATLALLVLSAAAFALPSVEAVQKEVQQGHYAQAESMMHEVVAAKPNSAKAHYIYAEILAHNGRFDQAAQEARLARQIDPQIAFTQPDKFRAFEQSLQREQATAKSQATQATQATPPRVERAPVAPAPVESRSGIPGWAWGLGFAAIAVLVWRLVSAQRRSIGPGLAGGASYGPAIAPGYGPVYGPMGGPAAPGSGMLGTGLAAAGGFAAGMLAEKMLDGRHGRDDAGTAATGGLVPGMFDDAPARNPDADELEQRSIDFGTGGDWDSGDAASGSGSDDGGW